MESKNMIIILVVIIVILAAVIGFMVLKPMHAEEPTKIKVISNKTLSEGADLSVKLVDLNKTPLSKEKVNITIKNSKGKIVVNKTVKTNAKGQAKVDLNLKKGKYTVKATYAGNENYTGNNTTQKLTIKEEVKETVSESTGYDTGGYDKYSPQYGTYIKRYTDSNGVQHIDGANGMRESYDPNTGLFSRVDSQGNEYQGYSP